MTVEPRHSQEPAYAADIPDARSVRLSALVRAAVGRELEIRRGDPVAQILAAVSERRSDVPLLVDHFLEKLNRTRPERPVRVNEEAMAQLWEYDWPGNVRELEHLLERVVILVEDSVIGPEHLPIAIRSFLSEKRVPKRSLSTDGLDLKTAVAEFEVGLIEQALRRTRGNKQAAARLLGLKRTTLVAKMQRRAMPPQAMEYLDVVI